MSCNECAEFVPDDYISESIARDVSDCELCTDSGAVVDQMRFELNFTVCTVRSNGAEPVQNVGLASPWIVSAMSPVSLAGHDVEFHTTRVRNTNPVTVENLRTMGPKLTDCASLLLPDMPLDANIQFMTIMATQMPFIGRG